MLFMIGLFTCAVVPAVAVEEQAQERKSRRLLSISSVTLTPGGEIRSLDLQKGRDLTIGHARVASDTLDIILSIPRRS